MPEGSAAPRPLPRHSVSLFVRAQQVQGGNVVLMVAAVGVISAVPSGPHTGDLP